MVATLWLAACGSAAKGSTAGMGAVAGQAAAPSEAHAAGAGAGGSTPAADSGVNASAADSGAPGSAGASVAGSNRAGAAATAGTDGSGAAGSPGAAQASAPGQIPAAPLPSVESASFEPSGTIRDIADDSAIYANPAAPELSVVVADDKDDQAGGVGVFDMQGKLLQFRRDGKIGNIDLRSRFMLAGQPIVLVGANNRTTNTLIFWQLDPTTRRLSAPIGGAIATTAPNYGFCLYHSIASGKFYAFVTQETGASVMEQYELRDSAGRIEASKVRSFEVGSITEGCVADDELGRVYVAQEDVGLWRYAAEPTGGTDRTRVASVGDGNVVADLEGVGLAKGPGNSGYLVVSIQSESRFVTHDRETNRFLRGFRVGANGAIDEVSQTDGLDISTENLGPGFPKGALIVHDGSNSGGESSNLKYVPLE